MFWGVNLKPNSKHWQKLDADLHILIAALDAKDAVGGDSNKIYVFRGNEKFLLCALRKEICEQVTLNLCFSKGDEFCFVNNGGGLVSITGYMTSDELNAGPSMEQNPPAKNEQAINDQGADIGSGFSLTADITSDGIHKINGDGEKFEGTAKTVELQQCNVLDVIPRSEQNEAAKGQKPLNDKNSNVKQSDGIDVDGEEKNHEQDEIVAGNGKVSLSACLITDDEINIIDGEKANEAMKTLQPQQCNVLDVIQRSEKNAAALNYRKDDKNQSNIIDVDVEEKNHELAKNGEADDKHHLDGNENDEELQQSNSNQPETKNGATRKLQKLKSKIVKWDPSLRVEDLRIGNGPEAKIGQKITVTYDGWVYDRELLFLSKEGKTPEFLVEGMKVGGTLYTVSVKHHHEIEVKDID